MEKILITGGSGFIGTNMVDYYLNKGIEILNVDIVKPLNPNHQLIWKKCDINDFNSISSVINSFNPTHILHLAAATGMDVSNITHFKTNYDGVITLTKACKSCDTLKKIVFTSSLLVCERGYVPKHDEDYKPDSLYGESKVMSEEKIRNSNLESAWSIVRPTAVWGPWFRSSYTSFFQLIKKGMYVNPGKKRLPKPATYVGNTVYMMDKILHSNDANGKVYYLADYPDYSIQEWAKSIANNLEAKEPIAIPRILINGIAKFGDF